MPFRNRGTEMRDSRTPWYKAARSSNKDYHYRRRISSWRMVLLTPTFEPPNPSMFRSRNENERIGLLIRRIIPQKKAIRNEEHLSAIFKLKRALRNRNDENIDDIDLHYDEKNDYTLKRRKEAREAGDSPPDGSISLFGGAVTIAPQHGKDNTTNYKVVHHAVTSDDSASRQDDIWLEETPMNKSSAPYQRSFSSKSSISESTVDGKSSSQPANKVDGISKSTVDGKPSLQLTNKVDEKRGTRILTSSRTVEKISHPALGDGTLSIDDFRGAEKFCRNAGKQRNGLHKLLSIINNNIELPVTLGLIWCDSTSNHFETTGKKLCKPSQQCNIWYCSCNRYIRVDRSYRPVLGVFFRFSEADEQSHCYYIPLAPTLSDISTPLEGSRNFVLPFTCETTLKDRWGALYSILCSSRAKIIYHAKLALLPILRNLEFHGFDSFKILNIFDPRVGAYIVSEEEDISPSEEPLELQRLCAKYFIVDNVGACDDVGRVTKVIAKMWRELGQVYNLHGVIAQKLSQTGTMVFFKELEMKVVVEMAKLELLGIRAEPTGFDNIIRQLQKKIEQLEREAADIAGCTFNLASPEQVSEILYNRLKIPPPASTSAKGKHFSTSEQDLKSRAAEYPIVQCVLDHRSCRKITTTFDWRNFLYDSGREHKEGGDPMEISSIISSSYSNAHNHVVASQLSMSPSRSPSSQQKYSSCVRIHPRWNLGFTRTGRLSCSSPNLQQVPKEFSVRDFSINIRSLFSPPSSDRECVFVAADYSQIEMRVLACACRDQNLIRLFQRELGENEDPSLADVYRLMASQIHGKPISEVSTHERSEAKTISLGIIYGMGAEQTAARLSISRVAAAQIIKKFHGLFPGISRWINNVKDRARMNGYVQTMGNFRRYLPDVSSPDSNKKATAERQSVNTIIQGSASEMIKMAMVSMTAAIESEEWEDKGLNPSTVKPLLVATIHDELLYSVHRGLVPKFIEILRRTMEKEVPSRFGLPLKFSVTVSSGRNWGELKEYMQGAET